MMGMAGIEPLSIWWADVKSEVKRGDQFIVSDESFERPVLIVDNKAYPVFKITSRTGREGYRIQDLEEAGLPMPSIVRTDILVPLAESDLRYQMGRLSLSDKKGLIEYLEGSKKPRMIGSQQDRLP